MKKIILLSALLISLLTFAQVPQGISYQAIALNASGAPVVNSNVGLKLSILDNSVSGAVLYSETHLKTTNANGLFNLAIGQGTAISGTFSSINWGTNLKFLKVEMDASGGTTYALVGTTQLLAVPYALAADSLITSAGESITLVSPNGTPFQLSVGDNGELSLPTSNISNPSSPNNFYLYGSFNSFNPATALLMAASVRSGTLFRIGYKYLTAGTELKFLAANNAASPVYGVNVVNNLALNGSSYLVNNTGFYYIRLFNGNSPDGYPLNSYNLELSSMAPSINLSSGNFVSSTYSAANNKFTFVVNGASNSSNSSFRFILDSPDSFYFGDNLADGIIDQDGTGITFPNLTSSPKNYRVELTLNFNGTGTYTITQI